MLKFQDVTVTLSGKDIVKDINFTVKSGRVTALLGRNGSGKSTLIRAVNGLAPFTGTILLDHSDLKEITAMERAKKVGFLPQILPQTSFTAEQVVRLGRNPYVGHFGILSEEDEQRVSLAMESAGVTSLADRCCDTLSGGERQRVFWAMLLCQDTPLVILDEPGTYLDTDAVHRWHQFCTDMVRRGKTVLLVTHDLGEAMLLADDIVLLEKGKILFEGSKERCLEEEVLEHHFGVERYSVPKNGKTFTFFI